MPGIPELERLAARSWRGLEEEPHGDWLPRAGGGFTGRANSVLVVGDPPTGLDDAVAAVTRWYGQRGLRPRAQVPMPGAERADAALAAAGWVRDDDNLVLTASPGRVAGTRGARRSRPRTGRRMARRLPVPRDAPASPGAQGPGQRRPARVRRRGGRSCLLQVAGGNAPALTLYARLGFTEHHRYHYRLGAKPGPLAARP